MSKNCPQVVATQNLLYILLVLKILQKYFLPFLIVFSSNLSAALSEINEYCYAVRSTFTKLKVIVTCTYSNLFAQGLKTRSFNVLWKTADHHETIECMIDVLGNLHNQMKLASTSLLLPIFTVTNNGYCLAR